MVIRFPQNRVMGKEDVDEFGLNQNIDTSILLLTVLGTSIVSTTDWSP